MKNQKGGASIDYVERIRRAADQHSHHIAVFQSVVRQGEKSRNLRSLERDLMPDKGVDKTLVAPLKEY
jgi:hypothetical protein